MMNECTYIVKLIGMPKSLKEIISIIHSKESKSFTGSDYTLLLQTFDYEFDWANQINIFQDINYFDGDDFCEIQGISESVPVDGFWEKISDEYDLRIEMEFNVISLNYAGIKKWDCGALVDSTITTYWQYIYQVDKDLFWEKVSKSSIYHRASDIVEILGDTYEDLSLSEKERIKDINKRMYSGI
jgi:hypothetical protein